MTETPHLLIEESDDILIATLNRPEKLNAMTGAMMHLFEDALHRFRDTEALKVFLVRAHGRYFCSGADLRQSDSAPIRNTGSAIRENHRLRVFGVHRIYDEMEHIEKPIVVAHHAKCIGGGLELSLSCDFRLAAQSASYAFPEGLFGVLPASNGVSRLTRICGPHWARYLVMANLPVSAERALMMGLVHDVFPDETFDRDVLDFCRHLAKQYSEQMGTAKVAIELAHDVGRSQGRHVERLANSALMPHPDFQKKLGAHVDSIGDARHRDGNSER